MGGIYRYYGTLDGYLTLMALLLPKRILPDQILGEPPEQQGLFFSQESVATDPAAAREMRRELSRRLLPSSLSLVRRAFLADRPQRELIICRYLLLAWEVGTSIAGMLAHPQAAPLWQLAQQVGREAHRYKGFVRFQEVKGGFFYAAIAPDHRILELVAPHFAARFADQHWVIHDTRHGEGVMYDRRGRWLLVEMEGTGGPILTLAEEQFQAWWRTWFTAVAIAERENCLLQQSKVPLKVRRTLIEFGS